MLTPGQPRCELQDAQSRSTTIELMSHRRRLRRSLLRVVVVWLLIASVMAQAGLGTTEFVLLYGGLVVALAVVALRSRGQESNVG